MIFDRSSLKLMYSRTFDHAPRLRVLPGLVICLMLAACGANSARITRDSFSVDSPYKSRLDSNSNVACESARRALLGDGYIIDTYSKENVKGRKAYRMESDRSTFIEMNVVCAEDPDGSMVYANGVLSTYDVKRSGASASVGVSALGSVSLPFGQSAESMVKTSDETIREKEFYRRFFNAVNVVMARIKEARKNAYRPAVPLSEQPKKGNSSMGEATQTISPNRSNATQPVDTEELPPTPPVEPARTAEALEAAHPKLLEDPSPATTQPQPAGENPSPADTRPAPAVAAPTTPDESGQPAPSATPDPTPAEPAATDVTAPPPETENQPPAASPAN